MGDWEVRPDPLRSVPPRLGPLAAESGGLARPALRLYSGFRIVAKNKGKNGEFVAHNKVRIKIRTGIEKIGALLSIIWCPSR